MRLTTRFAFFLLLLVLFPASLLPPPAQGDDISFSRDIQPILAEKCFNCHGPDQAEGGLQLHERQLALQDADSGEPALIPGQANASPLLQRITATDEYERMPPEGDPLSPVQVAKIRRWIEAGAKFDRHWAYVPVSLPKLPQVQNEDWVRNEIDRFVLAKLESEGVAPSPPAERAILAKRLYYDLIGLPPEPEVVQKFVRSTDPQAYEILVDQLLASEHFGERWGRHWLDKARYADSDGYEKDRPRPNAWKYRDWVIDAINRDMPFDQFTIEQLAGDLLPDATDQQKLATAFHRQTLTNTEGGTDQEEFRVEATFDRTETVGAIWMGLTLTCARCHTHKYDQITQQEYFQVYSFFNNANEATTRVPVSDAAIQKYQVEKRAYDQQRDKLTEKVDQAIAHLRPTVASWLNEQTKALNEATPLEFISIQPYRMTTSSGAQLDAQPDDAFLVIGEVPDKDKYTLFLDPPALTVSGIKLEVLADQQLPNSGPGRAPNGNFVLSQMRAYRSQDPDFQDHERLELVTGEADFSQQEFSPKGALSDRDRSGWAISPQMGKSHELSVYFRQPVKLSPDEKLQIVLDQQYGGKHLIGKFRLRLITGHDPLKSLPRDVAEVVRTKDPSEEQLEIVAQFLAKQDPAASRLLGELEKLKSQEPREPRMDVRIMAPATRTTRVLHRGDFLQPGKEVQPGVLQVIGASHELTPSEDENRPNRLQFARWLVDPEHPLTARVTVNHAWSNLFGRGLVATPDDFGVRGELPSHPELLDWLAWHFSRTWGWSRKQLIKTLVMNATYRQASVHRPELLERDPYNRWLARQNRIRVPAEIVRDLNLAVSGLLSRKVGGPSVFPPLPPGVADLSYANNFHWRTSEGSDRYRRGLYTFFKRTSPHPNLITFDCPDSNTTRIRRDVSNTPLQALVTLNNEVFLEAAQAMARRVLTSVDDPDRRMRWALRLCLVRDPAPAEVARFQALFERYLDYYQQHPDEVAKLVSRHAAENVSAEVNAAWVATSRMILNLDEFIVRE